MIDLEYVKNNLDAYQKNLENRQIKAGVIGLERMLLLHGEKKELAKAIQELLRKRNLLSGRVEEREAALALKETLQIKESRFREVDTLLEEGLLLLPNMASPEVPLGESEGGNVVVREVGGKPSLAHPKEYLVLTPSLIKMEEAAKVAGARFAYILGDLALLEFALIQLAFAKVMPHGFIPIVPPVMVKPEVMKKMGKAKFVNDNDAFKIADDDLYLVGSAEHSIGPLHMDSMFLACELPRRYVGFSTSFRREAGSYGKDTKGILRVHQFDKVELFSFVKPSESQAEHEFLLARQEELMQSLLLPYRVMHICTGGMGFGDYNQYDIETWLPGQGKYRETHSCSNTSDFQARGIRTKWRNPETGKGEFVHTLNATGFAIGRMVIAILENYQQEDGSVLIPKALQGYMGKEKIDLSCA